MKSIHRIVAACLLISPVLLRAGELRFKKHHIDKVFRSEGVAVGDVNRDGKTDILAGDLWYEAPDWKPHEIRKPGKYDGTTGYSNSFVNGTCDVNNDGWVDFLIVGFPGAPCHWYENPKGNRGHWKQHEIFRSACNESPQFTDLTGDGKIDLLMAIQPEAQMAWFSQKAEGNWKIHPISTTKAPGTHKYAHGLGIGDINKDGRNDVIITKGWWECPPDPRLPNWRFHRADLGPDAAHMFAYDVDDDGDMDVISSSAHNYGLWWHEQTKDTAGKTVWKRHEIFTKVSQFHALVMIDMNADGLPDLVTGKRYFAHQGKDPGGKETPFLFWFEFSRNDGKPTWTPHVIDDNSGIGTQFEVQDITADRKLDIIISNKKGVFLFEQL